MARSSGGSGLSSTISILLQVFFGIGVFLLCMFLVFAIAFVPISAWLLMTAWNWILTGLFNLASLGYYSALRIVAINTLICLLAVVLKSVVWPAIVSLFGFFLLGGPFSRSPIGRFLLILACIPLALALRVVLASCVFMVWWNHVPVDLFGVQRIDLVEALGLSILCSTLASPLFVSWQLSDSSSRSRPLAS